MNENKTLCDKFKGWKQALGCDITKQLSEWTYSTLLFSTCQNGERGTLRKSRTILFQWHSHCQRMGDMVQHFIFISTLETENNKQN